MNLKRPFLHTVRLALALALTAALGFATPLAAADDDETPAEKLWREFRELSRDPAPPKAWRTQKPSEAEVAKWQKETAERLVKAAGLAKEIYTKYPDDPNAKKARTREMDLLSNALAMGANEGKERLDVIERERVNDPNVAPDERFDVAAKAVQRRAMAMQGAGQEMVMAEMEKGARQLVKDFPKNPKAWQMLLSVANQRDGDTAVKVAREIIASKDAPDEAKEAAGGLIEKNEALGQPLAIKFTAVDGREVDFAKLKGKVVLVDFWATWCGPCVAELPNVMRAYEKLHPQGFEIVGISFDQSKEALTGFVESKKMAWPQYFDGQGWGNKLGRKYGINSIPAMWLVDKQGKLRDMNARGGLAEKVEKLLKE